MAQMKQCPQCGKYVAADRTYCMNCGITLGIRCPDCRTVLPVGSKTCTACGHSFVKKKKKLAFPLWDWMKKNAKPLVVGLSLLCLLLTLVLAAFPGVKLAVLLDGSPFIEHSATGYGLMGHFLGGDAEGLNAILGMTEFGKSTAILKTLFFLSGLGWLAILCGLILSAVLLIPNYKKFGKATACRLYLPLGIALGGAGLSFGLTFPISSPLNGGLAKYAAMAEDGYTLANSVAMPTVLLIATALAVGVHALLHVAVFRKTESEEEYSLSRILWVPLSAIARLLHRVIRFIRRKAGKKVSERDEPLRSPLALLLTSVSLPLRWCLRRRSSVRCPTSSSGSSCSFPSCF